MKGDDPKIDSAEQFTGKGLMETFRRMEPLIIHPEADCNCADATPCSEVVNTISQSNTLIAYWRLNEGASPYLDTSGFNPSDPADMIRTNLTVDMSQAYTPAATTEDATAVAFNADGTGAGNGDYLSASGLLSASRFDFTGTSSFTVAAWVLPFAGFATSLGGVVDHFHLTSWGPPTGFTDGWMLGVNQPAQTPYFQRLGTISYGASVPTATGAAITAGEWHLLVGVYDGATLRLYVDGVLAATQADASVLPANGNPPQIGIGQDTTASAKWFYGGVAEVSIWSDPLTSAEITTLFSCASAAAIGPIDSTENVGLPWGVQSNDVGTGLPEAADLVLKSDGAGGSTWGAGFAVTRQVFGAASTSVGAGVTKTLDFGISVGPNTLVTSVSSSQFIFADDGIYSISVQIRGIGFTVGSGMYASINAGSPATWNMAGPVSVTGQTTITTGMTHIAVAQASDTLSFAVTNNDAFTRTVELGILEILRIADRP